LGLKKSIHKSFSDINFLGIRFFSANKDKTALKNALNELLKSKNVM